MKDNYRGIVLCVAIILASFLIGDQAAAFGEGSWSDSMLCSLGVSTVQVDPYVRVGYQRMGVNLNVPIPPSGVPPTLNDMDVTLDKQDFLTGSFGVRALVRRIGLFAEATVSADQGGSVTTFFSHAVTGAIPTSPTGWSWPTSGVRWWEFNFGGGVNLTDAGGLLLGIKFDRLTQALTNPGNAYIAPVFITRNHLGDLDIQTVSPYIGFRFDDWYARIDLIWSPFLTFYKAHMPLAITDTTATYFDLLSSTYDVSGGGGNLLEAYGEGKFNLSHFLAAKLWLKASWMKCPGYGNRDFNDYLSNVGSFSGSGSAPGSLSNYLWAFGASGEIKL